MRLDGFVFFLVGAVSELIALLVIQLPMPLPVNRGSRFLARLFTPQAAVTGVLWLTAGGMLLFIRLLGVGGRLVYIDTPFVSIVFIALALVILAAALAGASFLPVINEQTILLTQLLVIAGTRLGAANDWLPPAVLAAACAGVSLMVILWPRAFHPVVKAVLYFWYLLSLLVMPFLSGEAQVFQTADLTWLPAYSLGFLLVFLVLNGLLAVRFFLIVSSLILPRNHALLTPVMPCLFSDQQVPLFRFALIAGLLAGLWAANFYGQWLPPAVALSLCALLGVQLLGSDLQQLSKPAASSDLE